MTDKLVYIINEDGVREEATILAKFRLANENDYIVYTTNEINEEGMIKIYVSGLISENGVYSSREITTDEEWNNLKSILKTLAKSEDEPFPETIKLTIKLIGEEIAVRRPKKLLVSKKFADIIGSKYTEESESNDSTPIVEIPVVEEQKEPEIEKTIKIPTFEELQARNKTIQSVMETAAKVEEPAPVNETPIIEPKVEEPVSVDKPVYESRVQRVDYEDEFKKNVEPVLMDVYAKQQKQIEDLEEELSKTKFDLFEKQKEALSLSNEKEEIQKKNAELEEQLTGVQKKMDGILSVLKDE
jgi:uncharacterized protein YrzB (UPF0473 family)